MSTAEEMLFQPTPGDVSEWAEQVRQECEALHGAELDARIDWLMEQMRENRDRAKANEDVAERRMDMIRHWRDEQNAGLDRQYAYLESLVLQHAAGYDYGKQKSRRLAFGKFGKRIVQRAGIRIVDKATALEFAKAHGIPTKVTEEVQVTPLKEYADSTGVLPAGCEPVPEVESFYVEVTK